MTVCHHCQRPGADTRAITGEYYHTECLPAPFKRDYGPDAFD